MSEHSWAGETIAEKVERHERDLYRGNGLPGLTTRMKQAEDKHVATEDRCNKSDRKLGRIEIMFWTIIVLLITVLVQNQFGNKAHEAEVPTSNHSFNY